MTPNESPQERAAAEAGVIAAYEALMHRIAGMHAPEFVGVDITMPQAKTLYLVGAAGEIHMSCPTWSSAIGTRRSPSGTIKACRACA